MVLKNIKNQLSTSHCITSLKGDTPNSDITVEFRVVEYITPIVSGPYGVESIPSFQTIPHDTINVEIK